MAPDRSLEEARAQLVGALTREAAGLAYRLQEQLRDLAVEPQPAQWVQPRNREAAQSSGGGMSLAYRLDGQERLLIYQEQEDGDWLWVDPPHSIPTFGSPESLQRYAARAGLSVGGIYPGDYEFDRLEVWLPVADAATMEYARLLDSWGLFETVAASVGALLHSSPLNQPIYQHLWVGMYAPPETIPEWLPVEVQYLVDHLRWGLELFRARTHPAG